MARRVLIVARVIMCVVFPKVLSRRKYGVVRYQRGDVKEAARAASAEECVCASIVLFVIALHYRHASLIQLRCRWVTWDQQDSAVDIHVSLQCPPF
jgi:hypothetical protein